MSLSAANLASRRSRLARRCDAVFAAMALAAALLVLAPAGSASAGGASIFSLTVTNNRSLKGDRSDLQYADDDGARYHAVFRAVTTPERALLLTRFDAPSRRLYPSLAAAETPPTRAALFAAVAKLRAGVLAAKGRGEESDFYFVFAGHGDVERGQGFLELEDGRLGARDLEELVLAAVPAERVHVVVDSCNSFFVLNPRKPGGRRWATPRDLATGFAARRPNVGVFLSTSAESEVFEWSELQGGIFSHVVRSGLVGAADADGDGCVTYDELAAFAATATGAIKNDHYRPKVFARGPRGQGGACLFPVAKARGRKVALGERARRLYIRDADGTRLADVHQEAGAKLTVTIPVDDGAVLTAYEWRGAAAGATGARPVIVETTIAASSEENAVVVLASADVAKESALGARGAEAIFGELFKRPFGKAALAEMRAKKTDDKEVIFGIGQKDHARMKHYLTHMADTGALFRRFLGGTQLAIGGSFVLGTLGSVADYGASPYTAIPLGIGALVIGLGVLNLTGLSPGEGALRNFERAMKLPGATFESVTARMEANLERIASDARTTRKRVRIFSIVYGGIGLAGSVAVLAATAAGVLKGGSSLYTSAGAVAGLSSWFLYLGLAGARFVEEPPERILRMYRTDPDLKLNVGISPVPGGAMLGLSGTF